MSRRRGWTAAKRRHARHKAEAALKQRRRIIKATRNRSDTSYAGLVPISQYSEQLLKVRRRFPGALAMTKGRNSVYHPEDEAMAYVGCQIAGIVRLNHMDRLLPEGVLAKALGIPQWMSENTQQRFLKRATAETLAGVDELTTKLVVEEELSWGEGLIEVDGDVTAVPQRGRKREGVQNGYCGGRVRPCYQQPRVTVNGLPWWTDLRPGKDAGVDVPERTLEAGVRVAQRHPKREVFCRWDGQWASRANLERAQAKVREHRNLRYLVAIHATQMKPGRWEEMTQDAAGLWKRVNSTTEIKELEWVKPWEDVDPVRAVAVRRQKRPPKGGKRNSKREPQWDLRYLIATETPRKHLGTRSAFERYHQRQREEFSFKDGKQSLATAKMPTMKLEANRMHVKMVGLAQVMLQLFARRFLPHPGSYGPTCKTIREKVVAVGGKNQDDQGGGDSADVLRLPLAPSSGSQGPR
jgi:hypothetical protein